MKKLLLVAPFMLSACSILDPQLYDSNIPVVDETAVNKTVLVKESPQEIEAKRKAAELARKERLAQVEKVEKDNLRYKYQQKAKKMIEDAKHIRDPREQACALLISDVAANSERKGLRCKLLNPLSDYVQIADYVNEHYILGVIRVFNIQTDSNGYVRYYSYFPEDRYLISHLLNKHGITEKQADIELCKIWPYYWDEHIKRAKNKEIIKGFKEVKANQKKDCLAKYNTWGV